MTYQRLAYDDQDTAVKMHTDCSACATEMGIPEQRVAPKALGLPVPTDLIKAFAKPVITVNEAAAKVASRIRLHLD